MHGTEKHEVLEIIHTLENQKDELMNLTESQRGNRIHVIKRMQKQEKRYNEKVKAIPNIFLYEDVEKKIGSKSKRNQNKIKSIQNNFDKILEDSKAFTQNRNKLE